MNMLRDSSKNILVTIKESDSDQDSDDKPKVNQEYLKEIRLYHFDVSSLSTCMQLVLGISGVMVFYIFYGYLQESIFLIPGFKPYGWYLTWFQFIVYTIISITESYILGIRFKDVPLKAYLNISLLTVATMGLSNASVGYLNYPTQVIFKCCKLIPTMIGGVIIQKIRYTLVDYFSIFLVVIGLIIFTLADSVVHPNFSIVGILMISLALCADGAIGNYQEKLMKKYNVQSNEMVFFSYSIGTIFITAILLLTNSFKPAFDICSENPKVIYGKFLAFSLTGYFGVQFILFLVKYFGALPAVTISTCRKAISIIISFTFFQKPFTIIYVYGGLIVVLGIYLNLYSKNREKWSQKCHKMYERIFGSGDNCYDPMMVV